MAGRYSGLGSGYEYDFVDAIAYKYNCGICLKVLRDAQLTVCCGQHYCETCLKLWLTSKTHKGEKSCPYCREEGFQSFPNKAIMREIKEFKIRCIHRGKGCEWVGQLGDLKDHLESYKGCGYVEVKCTKSLGLRSASTAESACGATMERRHLSHHQQKECVYRRCRCKYCGYANTYDAIAGSGKIRYANSMVKSSGNHLQECVEYPVDCPNNYCGKKNIKRKDLATHRDTVCPWEPVQCPYCKNIVVRKDMENHKKECEFRPNECQYCDHKWPYKFMNEHYSQCGEYPLECPNKCKQSNIKRKDMKAHRESCPLEPLECPLRPRDEAALTEDTCGRVLRRDMEKHKNEKCPHRPYKCQYCGQEGTYQSIIRGSWRVPCHYHTCQHYPLQCYNKCGEEGIKRKDMKEHQDTTCPLELLLCPFKSVGCTAGKIKRKDIDSHCQENIQQHLLLSYQELARKNEELERKNEELTAKVDQLTCKIEAMATRKQ